MHSQVGVLSMSNINSCGVDFGTTNSAIAIANSGDSSNLVFLEGNRPTIPTAVFFDFEDWGIKFGREGINDYIDGCSGRLMRSLKSILGSSLMDDTTQIGRTKLGFDEIIGKFIYHIKKVAEAEIGYELENTVVGRPVYFVDGDKAADQKAEEELKKIFTSQGFRDVSFELEPIAAAKNYEKTLSKEELALIIDVGGGTSDFSVIRLSPDLRKTDDRTGDVLANSGIHIGGTDFDKQFSLKKVMPAMGYNSKTTTGLPLPISHYHTLATWHEINSLYNRKGQNAIKELYNSALRKDLVQRLLNVVQNQRGHELASTIEEAKILLSDETECELDLEFLEHSWKIPVSKKELMNILNQKVEMVMRIAKETVIQGAGLSLSDVKTVFMTGGSTGLPAFTHHVHESFPDASIIHGDRFGSVAKGLGLLATQRYGMG